MDHLIPIRPASERESRNQGADSSTQHSSPEPVFHLPKRTSVLVACQTCRRKRIRCGGQRPSCTQCIQKGEKCVYMAEEGETVSLALRRRVAELEAENEQYKELYSLLKTRPDTECSEILRRIKASDDPREVLSFIKQAELLLSGLNSASNSSWQSQASSSPSVERTTGWNGELK